jgi:hypothetical protein
LELNARLMTDLIPRIAADHRLKPANGRSAQPLAATQSGGVGGLLRNHHTDSKPSGTDRDRGFFMLEIPESGPPDVSRRSFNLTRVQNFPLFNPANLARRLVASIPIRPRKF